MEKIDENRRGADKDVREKRRIYFAKVSREEAILIVVNNFAIQVPLTIFHTLAMSSVFLNSPLTRVTLPSSLNSVQRSFSSLFLAALLRPKLAPFTSSKKLGSGAGSTDFGVESAFRRPNIFSRRGREFVEA